MSTSDSRTPDDHDVNTSGSSPTGPGPDSTTASSPTGGDGTGAAQPDTGPGPAAADVDGDRTGH